MNEIPQAVNRERCAVHVLLVGGFHTPQITRLLKGRGVSFAVVQPQITKIDGLSGTEYLSVFSREELAQVAGLEQSNLNSMNVVVSRRAQLSEAVIQRLNALSSSNGLRVQLFLLLDETTRIAVPIDVSQLSELAKLQRLIAVQA